MKYFNLNWIGAALLVGAFGFSLFRVMTLGGSATGGPGAVDGQRMITITHWQLEPGYREAMQQAIDQYNNLPRVKAANVFVRQNAVTERFYKQFLNVNLVAGTAPDICEKGKAQLTGGDNTARYFEPLDDWVERPNPYNAPEYLPADLDPLLRRQLPTMAWRDTFIDGLQGGWDDKLQGYYAVPTSSFGAIRLFYNKQMLAKAKRLALKAVDAAPSPKWWLKLADQGFAQDTPFMRQWLASDQPPLTLGQLFVVCEAVLELGRQAGNDLLTPIAGSMYSKDLFASRYSPAFFGRLAESLDLDHNSETSTLETLAGLRQGKWAFDDAQVQAYYQCITRIAEYFPPGFLQLDREQANRRFVQENACMIATGGWDAPSLFGGAEGRVLQDGEEPKAYETVTTVRGRRRVNYHFDVGVCNFPMPAPGEKWGDVVGYRSSEAAFTAGAPYAVSQRSPNKDWAIDFLQYLTSYAVNQQYNQQADWIPVIVGTEPSERMMPFRGDPRGVPVKVTLTINTGNFGRLYSGAVWQYVTGDATYDELVAKIHDAMQQDRTGIDRLWYDQWKDDRISFRNLERMLSIQEYRQYVLDEPDAPGKYGRSLRRSALMNNATQLRLLWRKAHPNEPFPDF